MAGGWQHSRKGHATVLQSAAPWVPLRFFSKCPVLLQHPAPPLLALGPFSSSWWGRGPGFIVSHTLKSSSCRPGSPLSQKQTCCRQTDKFLTTSHIVAADWRLLHTAWEKPTKISALYCGCNPVLVNCNVSLPKSCHIFINPHQGLPKFAILT